MHLDCGPDKKERHKDLSTVCKVVNTEVWKKVTTFAFTSFVKIMFSDSRTILLSRQKDNMPTNNKKSFQNNQKLEHLLV
jgi:hypothetical protein